MTNLTLRIEPYAGSMGEYAPQLEFVKRHIDLLSPGFVLPREDWRTGTDQHLGNGDYVTVWEFGKGQGYKVTLNETLESRASGLVTHGVMVETFGLPEGCSILSKYETSFAHEPYIELRVSGPEEVVAAITEAFQHEFGSGASGDDHQPRTLTLIPGKTAQQI